MQNLEYAEGKVQMEASGPVTYNNVIPSMSGDTVQQYVHLYNYLKQEGGQSMRQGSRSTNVILYVLF